MHLSRCLPTFLCDRRGTTVIIQCPWQICMHGYISTFSAAHFTCNSTREAFSEKLAAYQQEELKQKEIAEREAKKKQREAEREAKEKERKKRLKEQEKRRAKEEAAKKEEQERTRKVWEFLGSGPLHVGS